MSTWRFTKGQLCVWKACDIDEVNRMLREGWDAKICR